MRGGRVTCAGPAGWRKSESGSAIIEMALALPVYLMLIFGLFEFSIAMLSYCSATYACRESARFASLHSTSSLAPATVAQVQAMVNSEIFLGSGVNATVHVYYLNPSTLATATNSVGNLVEVSASWSETVTIPWMSPRSVTIATQGYHMITR